MRYEIRAMGFSEILDTGFRLLRNHFVLVVGIAATLQIPLALIQAFATKAAEGSQGLLAVVSLVMALALLVISPIVGVAVTYALGEVYLGREATIGEAFNKGLAIFVPVLGTSLLAGLAVMGGFLLLIIPGIWVALGILLVSQVMVFERKFGGAALSRSFELMKGQRLRAFGIFLLVGLIQAVIGSGVQFALGAIPIVGPLGSGIVTSVLAGYTAAVSLVLYFDIRCRKEAFELEQLASLVEAGAGTAMAS